MAKKGDLHPSIYNVSKIKHGQILQYIQMTAIENKLKCYQPDTVIDDTWHQKKTDVRILQCALADVLLTPPTTVNIEREILTRTGFKNLQEKYRDLVIRVIEDVRNEFNRAVHEASLMCVIKCEKTVHIHPLRFLGKTSSYRNFLIARKYLENSLFLTHSPIRQILCHCVVNLPHLLIDLGQFRDQLYNFDDLVNILNEKLDESRNNIQTWYNNTPKLKRKAEKLSENDRLHYYSAAMGLISIYLTQVIGNTISHIIRVTSHLHQMPYIEMNLELVSNIILKPSEEVILQLYNKLVSDVMIISCNLLVLHYQEKDVDPKKIPIYIPESYVQQCKDVIKHNISRAYSPLTDYIETLNIQFKSLFVMMGTKETPELTYEMGFKKFHFYRDYLNTLYSLPNVKFYENACIIQSNFKNCLGNLLQVLVDTVTDELLAHHNVEDNAINNSFEKLASKAAEVPQTSEELMKLLEYMAWANDGFVESLKENAIIMIERIPQLAEMATFTEIIYKQNVTTIKWVNEITPALEASASMLEQVKADFEDTLQNCIENLTKEIEDYFPKLKILNEMVDCNCARDYFEKIGHFLCQIKEFDCKVAWVNAEEITFKLPKSQFSELIELKKFVYPFYHLVNTCANWNRCFHAWMDGSFEYLNYEEANIKVKGYDQELRKAKDAYKQILRKKHPDGYPLQFKGLMDDPEPSKHPAPMRLINQCLKQIEDFQPGLVIMSIVCNDSILQRHWDEMEKIGGLDLTPNAGTTLRKMINFNIMSDIDKYKTVSISAMKERFVLKSLLEMQSHWEAVHFIVSSNKIITNFDDIMVTVDDHLSKTISIRCSVFAKPYEKEIQQWYMNLQQVCKVLHKWTNLQNDWLLFSSIFNTPTICANILQEQALFIKIDTIYQNYILKINTDTNVLVIAVASDTYQDIISCIQYAEKISKGLTIFVEKRQIECPRLFFLTDKEILTADIKRCFDAVENFKVEGHSNIISGMYSMESEYLQFTKGVCLDTPAAIEQEMCHSMKKQITECINDYTKGDYKNWYQGGWVSQTIILVTEILFNQAMLIDTEKAISDVTQKLDLHFKTIGTPNLTHSARTREKLLLLTLHNCRIIGQNLIGVKISDFQWKIRLRYVWEKETCYIHMLNCNMEYGYEYLGSLGKIFATPGTERCQYILLNAYNSKLYSALIGRFGTEKVEIVRDLTKTIAVQFVHLTCSEHIRYTIIHRFLKGVASSGAWVCFEGFDRIQKDVLSVISQEMLCIVLAAEENAQSLIIGGTTLTLKRGSLNATINSNNPIIPKTIPDSIKSLFRVTAVLIPDYRRVVEVSLYSCGFVGAVQLAQKMVTVLKLCFELIPNESCYDMRIIRRILNLAEQNKLMHPEKNEESMLLTVLIQVISQRLSQHALKTFKELIHNLYPGVATIQKELDPIQEAILSTMTTRKLKFSQKTLQIYDTVKANGAVIILGESCTGKSTTLKIVADTITNVTYKYVNPKSIPECGLLGNYSNLNIQEWRDGIVTSILRNFKREPASHFKWIVFDGPIDGIWTENINTVLDYNEHLCLASGEIIMMAPNTSVIFETDDISATSPALVSRCSIVFLEPNNVGWRAFAASHLSTIKSDWCRDHHPAIISYLEWMFLPSLEFIENHRKAWSPGVMAIMNSIICIFEIQLNDACAESVKKEEDVKYMVSWIQAALLIAGVWGFGAVLDSDSAQKFDEFYRNLWKGLNEKHPCPTQVDISIPDGFLYDYTYLFKSRGNWKLWSDIADAMQPKVIRNITDIIIPTGDTVRYGWFIEKHIKHERSILLIGPRATCKSFYMKTIIQTLDEEKYAPIHLTLNPFTTASAFQSIVLSRMNKKGPHRYVTYRGKLAVIFIDDLNTPINPGISESLRHIIKHHTWYDDQNANALSVPNLLFVSAIDQNEQALSHRLLHHFTALSMNITTWENVAKIYSTVLAAHYKNCGFPNDITLFAQQVMVPATIQMYNFIKSNLLPSPTKSHYLFNMRHFYYVIYGCGLLRPESVGDDRRIFAMLWAHELFRVFYDKLADEQDRELFCMQLKQTLLDVFKENETVPENILFSSYLDSSCAEENRKYEAILNMEHFRSVIQAQLNTSTIINKLDLVLFDHALVHLSRILHAVTTPSGSAVLVGMSGCGRQSLTKLAAAITRYHLFDAHSLSDWRSYLKTALRITGGKGDNSILLLNDVEMACDMYWQDINNLFGYGDIEDMFDVEEKQEIIDMVREAIPDGTKTFDTSTLKMMQFFKEQCHKKLHYVFCFNPCRTMFRENMRLYPALTNCCAMDFFDNWPPEALHKVAIKWTEDINLNQTIFMACIKIHQHALQLPAMLEEELGQTIYVTNVSYLELLKLFTKLLKLELVQVNQTKVNYRNALDKFDLAQIQVNEMELKLAEYQPVLEKMKIDAAQMGTEIAIETIEVEKASELVRKDEIIANTQAAEAEALKAECEADLALAIPILEDAINALNTLKPNDITLVKSMKNPPDAIKLVMAAVCVIKDVKPDRIPDPATGRKTVDYWSPSKRILGDMTFLQQLKDFDKDDIKTEIMVKIRKDYLPHKDFKPHVVAKASSAAEGLCKWIIAIDMYDKVAKDVAPKKAKLEEAETKYARTMRVLQEKMVLLSILEEKLENLNLKLEKAKLKQQELQSKVDLCAKKLCQAKKLIFGLTEEKARWENVECNLQNQHDTLPGNILIASAIITYLSPCTYSYRTRVVQTLLDNVAEFNLNCLTPYVLENVLQLDQKWHISDPFMRQSAIIHDNAVKRCLLLDPELQVSRWIRKIEHHNCIKIVNCLKTNCLDVIAGFFTCGYPILIENINEGSTQLIYTVLSTVSSEYPIYLVSRSSNPQFTPELFNKVTIVNFSLTPLGLKQLLLTILITKEWPLIHLKYKKVVSVASNIAKLLDSVENDILSALSYSERDLLEDERGIQALNNSKAMFLQLLKKQSAILKVKEQFELFQGKYSGIVEHASILYYCIAELRKINVMYNYSLKWFLDLHVKTIEHSQKSRKLKNRLAFIKQEFTRNLYVSLSCSLLDDHKLIFSFLLCTRIMLSDSTLTHSELHLLMSDKPFVEPSNQMSPFQKLLFNKTQHPNKIKTLISNFVQEIMGPFFVTPIPYDLARPFSNSNCLSPIVLILSHSNGVDPMQDLIDFTRLKKMFNKLRYISLGQENCTFETIIKEGQANGLWVCLQNCHLVTSILAKIASIWGDMNATNTHPKFRLWMTMHAVKDYPTSLLQDSIKVMCQVPRGLQSRMLKLYKNFQYDDIIFNHVLYRVALFHCHIQERRNFGPIGWNIPYEFDNTDFKLSIQYTLDKDVMAYLLGECYYGGRIADKWDKRLLDTIFQDFLIQNVGLPRSSKYESYMAYIKKLPDEGSSELIDSQMAARMWSNLSNVFRASKLDSDHSKCLSRIISDISGKLPVVPIEHISDGYSTDTMNILLAQEIKAYNKLLHQILNSIDNVKKQTTGCQSPTVKSLLLGTIPNDWLQVSYLTARNLSEYVDDLIIRIAFIEKWKSAVEKTENFWLSALFYPKSFLTAIKLSYANNAQFPVTSLTYKHEVLADVYIGKGLSVYGLFCEGARWNEVLQTLEEASPKVLYHKMPSILFQVLKKSDVVEVEGRYQAPLYQTSKRRDGAKAIHKSKNYITVVLLNSTADCNYWIKKGVGLLCQTDEALTFK